MVPLFEQYGEQLEMVGVDTTSPGGSELFAAAIQRFTIPPERRVVPLLIIAETVLLGSIDIPEQFPRLIDQGLTNGGVDWPDIPGLSEALPEEPVSQPSPTALASGWILPGDSNLGLGKRLAQDLVGNSLAVYKIGSFRRASHRPKASPELRRAQSILCLFCITFLFLW